MVWYGIGGKTERKRREKLDTQRWIIFLFHFFLCVFVLISTKGKDLLWWCSLYPIKEAKEIRFLSFKSYEGMQQKTSDSIYQPTHKNTIH